MIPPWRVNCGSGWLKRCFAVGAAAAVEAACTSEYTTRAEHEVFANE
jgi:hypothetical protein